MDFLRPLCAVKTKLIVYHDRHRYPGWFQVLLCVCALGAGFVVYRNPNLSTNSGSANVPARVHAISFMRSVPPTNDIVRYVKHKNENIPREQQMTITNENLQQREGVHENPQNVTLELQNLQSESIWTNRSTISIIPKSNDTDVLNHSSVAEKILGKYHSRFKEGTLNLLNEDKDKSENPTKIVKRNNHASTYKYHSSFKIKEDSEKPNEEVQHFLNDPSTLVYDSITNSNEGKVVKRKNYFGERVRQYSNSEKSSKRPFGQHIRNTGFIIDHSNNNIKNHKIEEHFGNQDSNKNRHSETPNIPYLSDTTGSSEYVIDESQEENFYPGEHFTFSSELPQNMHKSAESHQHGNEITNSGYVINHGDNKNNQEGEDFSDSFGNVPNNENYNHQNEGVSNLDTISNNEQNGNNAQTPNLQDIISNIQGVLGNPKNNEAAVNTDFVYNHSANDGKQFFGSKDLISDWKPNSYNTEKYSGFGNLEHHFRGEVPVHYETNSNSQYLEPYDDKAQIEYYVEHLGEKIKIPNPADVNLVNQTTKSPKENAEKSDGRKNMDLNYKTHNFNVKSENQDNIVYNGELFSVSENNQNKNHNNNLQIHEDFAESFASYPNEQIGANIKNTSNKEHLNHRYSTNKDNNKTGNSAKLNLKGKKGGKLGYLHQPRNRSRFARPTHHSEGEIVILHDSKSYPHETESNFQNFHGEKKNNENVNFNVLRSKQNNKINNPVHKSKNVQNQHQINIHEPKHVNHNNIVNVFKNINLRNQNVPANNGNSFKNLENKNRNLKNNIYNRNRNIRHRFKNFETEVKNVNANPHTIADKQNVEHVQLLYEPQQNLPNEFENANFNVHETEKNKEHNSHFSHDVISNNEYYNTQNDKENLNLGITVNDNNETTEHIVDEVHHIQFPHQSSTTYSKEHEIGTENIFIDNGKYYPVIRKGKTIERVNINDENPHITFQSELNDGDIPQTYDTPITEEEIKNIHKNVKEHYSFDFKSNKNTENKVNVPHDIINTTDSNQNKNRKINSELGNNYLRFRNNFKKTNFEKQKKLNTQLFNDFHTNSEKNENNESIQKISNSNDFVLPDLKNSVSSTQNVRPFPKFIKEKKNNNIRNNKFSVHSHILRGEYHKVEDETHPLVQHNEDDNTHKQAESYDPNNVRDVQPEVSYIDSSQLPNDNSDDDIGVQISDNGAFYTQDSQGNLNLNANKNNLHSSNIDEVKIEDFPGFTSQQPQIFQNNFHHLEDLTGNTDVTITIDDGNKHVNNIADKQNSKVKNRQRVNSTVSSLIRNSHWNKLRGKKLNNNNFENNDKSKDFEKNSFKKRKLPKPFTTRHEFIIRKKPESNFIPIAPVTVTLPKPSLKVSYSLTPEAKLKVFLDTHKIPKTDFPFFDQYFNDVHSMQDLAEVMSHGYKDGHDDMFYEIPEVDSNRKPVFSKYDFPKVPKVEPEEPIRRPDFSTFDFHPQMPKMSDEYDSTFSDFVNQYYKPFENRKISFEITDFDNIPQYSNDNRFQHEEIENVTFYTLINETNKNETSDKSNETNVEINNTDNQNHNPFENYQYIERKSDDISKFESSGSKEDNADSNSSESQKVENTTTASVKKENNTKISS